MERPNFEIEWNNPSEEEALIKATNDEIASVIAQLQIDATVSQEIFHTNPVIIRGERVKALLQSERDTTEFINRHIKGRQ
jgi:hypothetical protein